MRLGSHHGILWLPHTKCLVKLSLLFWQGFLIWKRFFSKNLSSEPPPPPPRPPLRMIVILTWQSIVWCGITWHSMAWQSTAEHGSAWQSIVEHGRAWKSLEEHDICLINWILKLFERDKKSFSFLFWQIVGSGKVLGNCILHNAIVFGWTAKRFKNVLWTKPKAFN